MFSSGESMFSSGESKLKVKASGADCNVVSPPLTSRDIYLFFFALWQ